MSDAQPVLQARRVNELFETCLSREGEDGRLVEGIVHKVVFHPGRLEEHREDIVALLKELPSEFMESGGGGMSSLNACMDRHGRQWGEHQSMEQLFLLGMALDEVVCLMGRELWELMPGMMPYYMVKH